MRRAWQDHQEVSGPLWASRGRDTRYALGAGLEYTLTHSQAKTTRMTKRKSEEEKAAVKAKRTRRTPLTAPKDVATKAL